MKKHVSLIIVVLLGALINSGVQAAEKAFPDIKESDWFYNSVMTLTNEGLISGYPNGNFGPNNTITVAEFSTIVARTYAKNFQASSPWYMTYIEYLEAKKIIMPDEFSDLDYTREITRGEMARIIYRGLEANGEDYSNINVDALISEIEDYSTTKEEYKEFILGAYQTGIMSGYPDGTFGANKNARRCEAAVMIHRLMDKSIRAEISLPLAREINREGTFLNEDGEELKFNGQELTITEQSAVDYYNKFMKIVDVNEDWQSNYNIIVKSYEQYTKVYFNPLGNDDLRHYRVRLDFYHNPTDGSMWDDKPYKCDYQYFFKDDRNDMIVKEFLKLFYPSGYESIFTQGAEIGLDRWDNTKRFEGSFDGRQYLIDETSSGGVLFIVYK